MKIRVTWATSFAREHCALGSRTTDRAAGQRPEQVAAERLCSRATSTTGRCSACCMAVGDAGHRREKPGGRMRGMRRASAEISVPHCLRPNNQKTRQPYLADRRRGLPRKRSRHLGGAAARAWRRRAGVAHRSVRESAAHCAVGVCPGPDRRSGENTDRCAARVHRSHLLALGDRMRG